MHEQECRESDPHFRLILGLENTFSVTIQPSRHLDVLERRT